MGDLQLISMEAGSGPELMSQDTVHHLFLCIILCIIITHRSPNHIPYCAKHCTDTEQKQSLLQRTFATVLLLTRNANLLLMDKNQELPEILLHYSASVDWWERVFHTKVNFNTSEHKNSSSKASQLGKCKDIPHYTARTSFYHIQQLSIDTISICCRYTVNLNNYGGIVSITFLPSLNHSLLPQVQRNKNSLVYHSSFRTRLLWWTDNLLRLHQIIPPLGLWYQFQMQVCRIIHQYCL